MRRLLEIAYSRLLWVKEWMQGDESFAGLGAVLRTLAKFARPVLDRTRPLPGDTVCSDD